MSTQSKSHSKCKVLLFRVTRVCILSIIVMAILGLSGCFERLAYYPFGTPSPPPEGAEEVQFRTDDDLNLHGWYFCSATPPPTPNHSSAVTEITPKEDDNQPNTILPIAPEGSTVLFTHGNAGNIEYHDEFVHFLTNYGFNVLVFDYRSYGNSDSGKLNRNNLLIDTEAALTYLKTRSDVDPDNIIVFGHSLGCVFASHLMLNHPEIKTGVFVSSFASWQAIAASVISIADPPGIIARNTAKILMPAGLDPIDALSGISDRPILLVHGINDSIVPYSHAKTILQACEDAKVDVQLISIDNGDHNDLRWEDRMLDYKIATFLIDNLKDK